MSGMEIFNCPLSSSPEKELPSPEIVSLSSPVPVPPLDSTKVANESGCLNVSTKHKNHQSTSKPNSNLPMVYLQTCHSQVNSLREWNQHSRVEMFVKLSDS